MKGLAFTLLTSINKSISAILAKKTEGAKHPIYYLSPSLGGLETNCSLIQRQWLEK